MTHIPGKFVWRELHTSDVARAKAWYTELFGWSSLPMDMGEFTYEAFGLGERPLGGFVESRDGVTGWRDYLSVEDVDAAVAAAKKAGGKVLGPVRDVPGVGRMALVEDGEGAQLFLFRSADGDAADGEGAPGLFHWEELWSREPAKAVKFYRALVPYAVEDMPMPAGPYHILKTGDVSRCGIGKATGESGTWLSYVQVDDCDQTLGRAESLGGKVQVPATDIPNVGRFAVVSDPDGAAIGVIRPASA